jgi:hypothetical protein
LPFIEHGLSADAYRATLGTVNGDSGHGLRPLGFESTILLQNSFTTIVTKALAG